MKRIAVLCAAGVLTGCACGPGTPKPLESRLMLDNEVFYVTRLNDATLPDGTLRVGVNGGTCVEYPQKVRYRPRWYDQHDLPINTSVDNWEVLNLAGEGAFEFALTAPGPRAKRYVIEFQR